MIAISFILGIILIGVIFVILAVAVGFRHREEIESGGDEVIRNVFVYLVLFATLMMSIGGTVAAFMAVADMVAPAPYYQSYEEYRMNSGIVKPIEGGTPVDNQLSDAEIKANYDAMVLSEQERQMERAKNSLIKSLGWVIIPLPVFFYFQRRLRAQSV